MSSPHLRSHAAHLRKDEDTSAATLMPSERPSQSLHPKSEHVRAVLEELDDVIFHAIRGDPEALAQAKVLWPQVITEIGWELAEESREQYLRYAIEVTQRLENEDLRTPERAISALDVISLLAKD
ncbi:MAG: hypothetical protein GXP28_06205 [Planctomycetes bacterium]|nr:hypothetical protein [Planctomycetota bacterium]